MLSEEGRGDNAAQRATKYLQLVHQAVCLVSNSRGAPRPYLGGGKGLKDLQVQTDEQEGQRANGKADELAASSISWAAEFRL